ncbi:MAG TPA: GNAT family N-acetyltransferase [Chitinolyticbacter sp.]|nr:GNAT family N-acetyltransferase [Chitinolyticbacter sp.]
MGGGAGLAPYTRAHLVDELARRPGCHVLLAFHGKVPAGIAICFEGFSTFTCRPLLNIHDLVVSPDFRCRGIGSLLLAHAEALACRMGCCKLTLEVLEGNAAAQALYLANGYASYALDPAMGRAMFWQKKL